MASARGAARQLPFAPTMTILPLLRPRVYGQGDAELGAPPRHRSAADRARQAEPERVRGFVQRTIPRRVFQRALVHVACPCPRRYRSVAPGKQRRANEEITGRADTRTVREAICREAKQVNRASYRLARRPMQVPRLHSCQRHGVLPYAKLLRPSRRHFTRWTKVQSQAPLPATLSAASLT